MIPKFANSASLNVCNRSISQDAYSYEKGCPVLHPDNLNVVELPRFELRITEPKSAVLPLHHSSIVARKRVQI